jgi:hypothetical protein
MDRSATRAKIDGIYGNKRRRAVSNRRKTTVLPSTASVTLRERRGSSTTWEIKPWMGCMAPAGLIEPPLSASEVAQAVSH